MSKQSLFLTTLKSNFKLRLRASLKHLGSLHDPLSHGNWSKGAGMYGGKGDAEFGEGVRDRLRGQVFGSGKYRQRSGTDGGGGGGGGGGTGAPKRAKQYKLTSKGLLKKQQSLDGMSMKKQAIRDALLGRPETPRLAEARKVQDELVKRYRKQEQDSDDQQAFDRTMMGNRVVHARAREVAMDRLYGQMVKKYASNTKVSAYLQRDATNALRSTRDSQLGKDFLNQVNVFERNAAARRESLPQRRAENAPLTEAQIDRQAALDVRLQTARAQSTRRGDRTANDAMMNVRNSMIQRIRDAAFRKDGTRLNRTEAEIIFWEAAEEAGRSRFTTSAAQGGVTNQGSTGES